MDISIRTLQGVETDSPHMTHVATFYFRANGELFVEPIQTGQVVTLAEWRCHQKHDFDVERCRRD